MKDVDEPEICAMPILQRLRHRIRVTYFIEGNTVILGLTLLIERQYEEAMVHGVRIVTSIDAAAIRASVIGEVGIALIIAATLSVMYEVQHREGAFGKPVRDIRELTANLGKQVEGIGKLTENLDEQVSHAIGEPIRRIEKLTQKLDLQIEETNRISGYLNYRRAIQNAYGLAQQRILSASDFWIVDNEWWKYGEWDACPLYCNLKVCLQRSLQPGGQTGFTITFAGDVPWPDNTGAFSEPDFERFIGCVWRLVIAHKLRQEFALTRKDTIRVVVATVPVPATIVDNEVFIFLQRLERTADSNAPIDEKCKTRTPDPLEGATGTKIVGSEDKNSADAYEVMMLSYLRHVRSAREYVEAVLYFASLMSRIPSDLVTTETDDVGETKRVVNEATVRKCLEGLGLMDWQEWKTEKDHISREKCIEHAISAVSTFLEMHAVQLDTFQSVRGDLL